MMRRDLGAYVAIISAGRPGNVVPLSALVGMATWVVPEPQMHAYRNAGAELVAPDGGGLCAARNAALAVAFDAGVPCIQVSDDLRRLKLVTLEAVRPLSFQQAARLLLSGLGDARLAGCAPTDNPFYVDRANPIRRHHFVVGDLIAVAPCMLRFDTRLRLKEDYDYTLQHLATYGLVHRRDDILASFLHRDNAGGAAGYRTRALEQESIAYLKDKWPGRIVDNPRRANEVLLRWPRTKRQGAA